MALRNTMNVVTLSAKLDRSDDKIPWGFRLHGGKDFGAPFTIQKVNVGSLAQKCGLLVGDTILMISGRDTVPLTHKDAQHAIMNAKNSLELTLQRGSQGGAFVPVAAPGAVNMTVALPPAVNSVSLNLANSAQAKQAPKQQANGPTAVGIKSPPHIKSPPGTAPAHIPAPPAHNNAAHIPNGPSSAGVPIAVNHQYNSPINLYSVDNAMSSLAAQAGAMNLHGSHTATPAPSSGRNSVTSPISRLSTNTPASMVSGEWRPTKPTGPRTMKRGPAKTIQPGSPGSSTTKIPICDACGSAIRGPFVLALNKSWCPNHFICSNPHCKQPLVDIGFVEEDGQLFCEVDYEKYFAPVCKKCSKPIMRECVNALKETYHPDCFVCFQCKESIGTGSFHIEEGREYCERDWQTMFQTKCYGCQFPIEPGDRWVEALNQNWHSECFNCSTCQINLEGQGFYAKNGKPFCKKHVNAR